MQAPNLVGQCRHAQIDAFAPVSFALAVQRLMLAELLKQDHGQQVGPAKPRAWPILDLDDSRSRWARISFLGQDPMDNLMKAHS